MAFPTQEAASTKDSVPRSRASGAGGHGLPHRGSCARRGPPPPPCPVPTAPVGKQLHLLQGVQLLVGAAGHAEGGGTGPPSLDLQVAGVHEEHVPRRDRAGGVTKQAPAVKGLRGFSMGAAGPRGASHRWEPCPVFATFPFPSQRVLGVTQPSPREAPEEQGG